MSDVQRPGGSPGGGGDRRLDDARSFVDKYELMLGRLRPGQAPPPLGNVAGTDATGLVRCTLDGDGVVTAVRLESGWWEELGSARVGAAILDAVRFAQSKVEMAQALRSRHGFRPTTSVSERDRSRRHDLLAPLPELGAPDHDAAVMRKLELAFATLDAAERSNREYAARRAQARERRTLTGTRGLFRVTVEGKDVVGAEVNDGRLGPGDGTRLAEDALGVLASVAAARGAGRTGERNA